ncbi:AraC family transcriptional regulator [Pendulispora rubella]|uniref:AraC family transcriptional regulator n=1 Tax=Pendulispora rubella TaxID=2741070 RepID=A0ABZ2LCS0_9BACT
MRKPGRSRGIPMASFFIPKVLAHVRAMGGRTEELERQFDIPAGLPASQMYTASPRTTRDCADAAERVIDDPFLGLHLAIAQKRGSFGILDFAVRSAPTVGAAIQRLAKYQRLINNLSSVEAEVRNGELLVSHRFGGDPLGTGRHGHELMMAAMLKTVRDLTSEPIIPKLAKFAHARSSNTLELKEFFGIDRLEFDRGVNMLVFPAETIDMPIVTADVELLEFLDRLAERHLQSSAPTLFRMDPGERNCSASVRNYIVDTLRRGEAPSIEHAAEFHRMSVRTLQRRLDETGTDFHELVDWARRELSLAYLDDACVRTGEVAKRLGYADVRSFIRAFRRWMGRTPAQHRKRR